MPNIAETLRNASEILEKSGIAEPRREANSLLAFALQKNKTFLIAHSEYELSAAESGEFQGFLERRASREPLQYIKGEKEFFGLNFIVTPDVLIPRPETELLVETAIEILKNAENPRFCEIGVGSGCVSISLLHELKKASAIGVDISEKALQIAVKNAENNRVLERFALQISDVFAALPPEKFDLIVSNPPYIASEEIINLQAEVRDFEPLNALTDGKNGLSIIENIILNAPKFLNSGGFLLLEIGFAQADKVTEMFDAKIWESIAVLPDLQEIPRTVRAQLAF